MATRVQAQVQVEANELSLDVCKFYLCIPSPLVLFQLSVFMCLLRFSFAGVFSRFVFSLCENFVLFKFALLLDLPFIFRLSIISHQFNCCPRFYFTLAGYF